LFALIQKDADDFYKYNNNKQFNSIEDSICHLAFVERIEAVNSSKVNNLKYSCSTLFFSISEIDFKIF
jgi:hypothetical protein